MKDFGLVCYVASMFWCGRLHMIYEFACYSIFFLFWQTKVDIKMRVLLFPSCKFQNNVKEKKSIKLINVT